MVSLPRQWGAGSSSFVVAVAVFQDIVTLEQRMDAFERYLFRREQGIESQSLNAAAGPRKPRHF
jgi:hypothetical protein